MRNHATVIAMGVLLFTCSWASTIMAVGLGENIELHGYGHVGLLATDTNRYLNADNGVSNDYKDLALLFTASLNERSKAWLQLFHSDGKSRVDWAFVDYQVTNSTSLRLGQIKLPIGLYNEIRDIEFIRPSSLKPFMYHEASEIANEAYRGLGVAYDHELGSGNLTWDLYTGQSIEYESSDHRHQGLIGGRITYQTPVEGLRAMISAFSEKIEILTTGETSHENAHILSLDYTLDALDLKAEYGREEVFGKSAETWYVQAAYAINERWRPYLRYDYITTDRDNSNDPSFYQNATVVGLGYTFNEHIGMRLETLFNHGYAMPVAAEEMEAGTGKTDWQMTAVSINFNF
jgi:hypothetical protein